MTLPVTLHVGMAPPQEIAPVLQGLPRTGHDVPLAQLQLPLEQARLLPQTAPFARALPVSTHVGVPLLHTCVPAWQGLDGVQGFPT